jgi:hypothetical protein
MDILGQSRQGCLLVCTAPISFTGLNGRRRQVSNLTGLANASFDPNPSADRQAIASRHVYRVIVEFLMYAKYIWRHSFRLTLRA